MRRMLIKSKKTQEAEEGPYIHSRSRWEVLLPSLESISTAAAAQPNWISRHMAVGAI